MEEFRSGFIVPTAETTITSSRYEEIQSQSRILNRTQAGDVLSVTHAATNDIVSVGPTRYANLLVLVAADDVSVA